MELTEVKDLALSKMREHGLEGWSFQFDNAKKRLGVCNPSRQIIGLSAPLARINDLDTVRNTILHEIAHALAPARSGHGSEWKRICREIGARPERCANGEEIETLPSKYVGTCPKCSHTFKRDRLSARLKQAGGWCPCVKGYDPAYAIVWSENRLDRVRQ